jgi:hypothetical protein
MTTETAGAEVRSGEEEPVKRIPGRGTFELTCDGPGWKALPVVNGHVCPAASADVHVDPEHFPEVTLRLVAAGLLKLGFDPAVVKVDDESREALISLGWTPPAEPGPAIGDC